MAVKVTIDKATGNRVYEFSTVGEALEFELQASGSSQRPPAKKAAPRTAPIPANGGWEGFVAALAARKDEAAVRMRKLLALVKGRGMAGLSWADAARDLGIPEGNAYGTYSGLVKAIKSAGLTPSDVIVAGPDKMLRPARLLIENDPPTP